MADITGFRSFPETIPHPSKAELFSEDAFVGLPAEKMESAPSACAGHEGTVIWYVPNRCYVVEVKLTGKRSIFAASPCTFTPTSGMDSIDGQFAQDVEEYFLHKELGFPTKRLAVFEGHDCIATDAYLRARGVIE